MLFTFIFSCNKNRIGQYDHLVLDSVEFVLEFPNEFVLNTKEQVNIDLVGVWDFAIHDSILILSTKNLNGTWKFLSLPEYNHLGDFLSIGEGPLELSSFPSVSDKVKLTKENNEYQAYIYDWEYGKLLKLDVSKSIEYQDQFVSIINESVPRYLFDFLMIDVDTYFCRELGNMDRQQLRYLYTNGDKAVNPTLEKLNASSVLNSSNFNILSTMTRLNDQQRKIVEMYFRLNYINIYSYDGFFNKTICVENKLDDISTIENMDLKDRFFKFSDVRVYNDFFGVVYINEKEGDYSASRRILPSILLFNWNGDPLAKIQLESSITSFDIDFNQNELYTFDVQADEFSKYDISHIINEINTQ